MATTAEPYPGVIAGEYIVGKTPIHTQLVIKDSGGISHYIPVKAFTWSKDTDQTENLHSGTPLASDLLDGHHKYSITFETGTWHTKEQYKEIGTYWEYLAYMYLIRPNDAGRARPFTAIHRQSSYYDDEGNQVGDKDIMTFTGCKIRKMGMSQGENGIIKRTYEAGALRMHYGQGGASTSETHAQAGV